MLPPKNMGTVTYIAPAGNYTIQVKTCGKFSKGRLGGTFKI
jgi:hypothetical protein